MDHGHVQLLPGLQASGPHSRRGRQDAEGARPGKRRIKQKEGRTAGREGQSHETENGERRNDLQKGGARSRADKDYRSTGECREADLTAWRRGRTLEGERRHHLGGTDQSNWQRLFGHCRHFVLWAFYGQLPQRNDGEVEGAGNRERDSCVL